MKTNLVFDLGNSTGWLGVSEYIQNQDNGSYMYTAGYPKGNSLYLTGGEIMCYGDPRANRDTYGDNWSHYIIATKMDIESGQSGSPVFTEDGYVKGVICLLNNDNNYISGMVSETYEWVINQQKLWTN